jgi:hypothetical protein
VFFPNGTTKSLIYPVSGKEPHRRGSRSETGGDEMIGGIGGLWGHKQRNGDRF